MSGADDFASITVVVTSIAAPNRVMQALSRGTAERGGLFYLVGDVSSPPSFDLPGCRYFDVGAQLASGLETARLCPTRHYARKNVGYLLAARDGARIIVETDDDNFPRPSFWTVRRRHIDAAVVESAGWVNVYRYFAADMIWPRGFPLDQVRGPIPDLASLVRSGGVNCPIQQGLADENPDVDAIYRLLFPLPLRFAEREPLALGRGSWCPFNSQNTTWFRDAFPLMYLPAYCSFRMTDIWRSFVAQRICWLNGWSVLYHNATVEQERNWHDLMKDFRDEVPGYVNNGQIVERLTALSLEPGPSHIAANMIRCYEAFLALGVVDRREIGLLESWLADLHTMGF